MITLKSLQDGKTSYCTYISTTDTNLTAEETRVSYNICDSCRKLTLILQRTGISHISQMFVSGSYSSKISINTVVGAVVKVSGLEPEGSNPDRPIA